MIHLVILSPLAPLASDSFLDFSCFGLLWQFWEILFMYVIKCTLIRELSDNFLIIKLRLWVLWKKITEVKYPFHQSYQGYILSTWLITIDVDFDHLAEVVFVRILNCQVFLFSPHFNTAPLEESHYIQCTLRVGRCALFIEGEVFTWITLDSSVWENCLFSLIYSVTQ